MPKPTTELTHDEYIKSLNLAPDDEKILFDALGKESIWSKAKAGIMRHSDWSREKDALKQAQAELDAANADVETFRETLVEWQGKSTAQVEADEKRLQALELELSQKAIALRAAAREAGVDIDTLVSGGGGNPAVPDNRTKPEPSSFDPSAWVSKEEIGKYLREGVNLTADQLDLLDEHRSLFPDKPLKFKELVAEAITHKMTPSQWWEKKYSVPEARTAKAEAAIEARVKAAADEGYIRGRSESGKPSPRVQPSSALFQGIRGKAQPRTDHAASGGEHIQKAVNDFYKRMDYAAKRESEYDN